MKSYVGTPLGSWRPLLGEILDPPLLVVAFPFSSMFVTVIYALLSRVEMCIKMCNNQLTRTYTLRHLAPKCHVVLEAIKTKEINTIQCSQ